MKKRIFAVLTAIVLLCAFLPLGAVSVSAETATSGTTGDCTWTLDNKGRLTISGNGAMGNYDSWINNRIYHTTAPWGMDIISVTIGDGVTTIGEYAFAGCTSLTKALIPDSVTTIEKSAFIDCHSLKSVTIPDSITTIRPSVFADCTSLKSVTIPDSIAAIEAAMFSGCTSLENVTIPDSITTIEGSAFASCHALKSLTIPDSVTTIEDFVFYHCDNLESVILPDSVTTIEEHAFNGCTALTDVYYTGTEEDFVNITIENDNELLLDADWHYEYVVRNTRGHRSSTEADFNWWIVVAIGLPIAIIALLMLKKKKSA